MEVGKTLKVVITLEDYRIMGSRLFAFLERLRASHIILAAAGADTACAEFTSLVEMLAAQGLDVTLSSQTPLEGSPAYGRDSIAAVPHIFEEHFLSKEDFVSCRLRDQGDPRQILKGEAALLTSNLIAKPAFYAYWLLSSLKGRLLAWSKYYSVVAADQDGAPTYILTVMNFNDEIQRLCLRNASIHETDDVIHRFRDELNLDFTLPLPPGNYMVVKYALENENSIFHYMSQLGFPEECPLPDQWSSMFCTHPRTHGDLEQVTDVLNVSFTLQGAGMQIAIIQRAEGAAYDWM